MTTTPAAPLTTPTGSTGADGAVPLSLDEYFVEADDICGPANRQVGALDPTDPNATQDEFRITKAELQQLQSLELDDPNRQVTRFLDLLSQVVAALRAKAVALDRNDTVTAEEAQVDIDTNEAEARALGEQIGFTECGQFLDAGQAPAGGGGTAGTDTTGTDTGGGRADGHRNGDHAAGGDHDPARGRRPRRRRPTTPAASPPSRLYAASSAQAP